MTLTLAPSRPTSATAQHFGICLAISMFALLYTTPSWAIYQCTIQGKTSFQDFPCADNASQSREIVVAPPPATTTLDKTSTKSTTPLRSDQLHQQNRLRDLDNTLIPQARQRLQSSSKQCNERIKSVENKKAFPEDKHTPASANQPLRNLALATRDQALSAEMQAIATQCATEHQRLQSALDQLIREKSELESALRR